MGARRRRGAGAGGASSSTRCSAAPAGNVDPAGDTDSSGKTGSAGDRGSTGGVGSVTAGPFPGGGGGVVCAWGAPGRALAVPGGPLLGVEWEGAVRGRGAAP